MSAFSEDAGLTITGYTTLSESNTSFDDAPATQFYGDYNDATIEGSHISHGVMEERGVLVCRVYHTSIDACGVGFGETSIIEHTPVTELFTIGEISPNPAQESLNFLLESEENVDVKFEVYGLGRKLIHYSI